MTAPAPDPVSTSSPVRVCEAGRVGLDVCEAPATVAVALAHLEVNAPDCSPRTALLCTTHLEQTERRARDWRKRRDQICSACCTPIRRTGEFIRWVEQL